MIFSPSHTLEVIEDLLESRIMYSNLSSIFQNKSLCQKGVFTLNTDMILESKLASVKSLKKFFNFSIKLLFLTDADECSVQ